MKDFIKFCKKQMIYLEANKQVTVACLSPQVKEPFELITTIKIIITIIIVVTNEAMT